jgi:hypothetical protein
MSDDIEERVSFLERMLHRKWGQKWECCDCHEQFLMDVEKPGGHYSWYGGLNASIRDTSKDICLKCLDRREAEIKSFKTGTRHGLPIRVPCRSKGGDE